MRIIHIVKKGYLKGYTIRQSKHGWYDLYSDSGISQDSRRETLEEIFNDWFKPLK